MPILSENACNISTRFGKADDFVKNIEDITKKKIISSIEESEKIGPNRSLEIMIIAPCTGNTLAKLANGIVDTSVTMAAKAHLRNQKPLVIGLCTNDALSANLINIGIMLNKKNVFLNTFIKNCLKNRLISMLFLLLLYYKEIKISSIFYKKFQKNILVLKTQKCLKSINAENGK